MYSESNKSIGLFDGVEIAGPSSLCGTARGSLITIFIASGLCIHHG